MQLELEWVKLVKEGGLVLTKEDSLKELITFVEDRAEHDRRYAIEARKLQETLLGRRADEDFEREIVKTINCSLEQYYG